MKDDLLIDAAAVRAAAQRIDGYNETMHERFWEVHKKVTGLRIFWSGEASDCLSRKYYRAKESCFMRQYLEMRKYTEFMRELVSEGYETTETENREIGQQLL